MRFIPTTMKLSATRVMLNYGQNRVEKNRGGKCVSSKKKKERKASKKNKQPTYMKADMTCFPNKMEWCNPAVYERTSIGASLKGGALTYNFFFFLIGL